MKTNFSGLTVIGALCGMVACIGDFVITLVIGFLYKGYDSFNYTESYLGNSASPYAVYIKIWGVIFGVLFIIYALALRKTLLAKGTLHLIAVWLVVIYSLGEGIGSGLFPYDWIGDNLTVPGKIHAYSSGIGDAALILLPFLLWKIFPKKLYPKLNRYTRFVAISGLALIIISLLTWFNIVPVRGLWQRLYLLDYYSLLIVLSAKMLALHFTGTQKIIQKDVVV